MEKNEAFFKNIVKEKKIRKRRVDRRLMRSKMRHERERIIFIPTKGSVFELCEKSWTGLGRSST
jgi:hypothetical protein